VSCSRCGATGTRLVAAHWAPERHYCPACCEALDRAARIPTATSPAPSTLDRTDEAVALLLDIFPGTEVIDTAFHQDHDEHGGS
jgi:hypothetical protein